MSKKLKTQAQTNLLYNKIANNLVDKINQHKLQDIADKLGVHRVTLSRYLTYGIDNIDTLVRVCNALETSYVDVLCGEDERQEYLPCACPRQHAGEVLHHLRLHSHNSQLSGNAQIPESVLDLAGAIKVDERMVRYYEAQGIANITSVLPIAKHYNVPIAEFFCVRRSAQSEKNK